MNNFKLPHTSASDTNLMHDNPFAWRWKHADFWGRNPYQTKITPVLPRGNAVEHGGDQILLHQASTLDASDAAQKDFLLRVKKEKAIDLTEEEAIQYNDIPTYISQLHRALNSDDFKELELGKFISRQGFHKDIIQTQAGEMEFVGYSDWTFENGTVDLKSTTAIPSVMRDSHAFQLGFYADMTGLDQYCLYCKPVGALTPTGKVSKAVGFAFRKLNKTQQEFVRSERIARAKHIAAMYSLSWEQAQYLTMPRDIGGFRWDDGLRELANKEWGILK